MYVQEGNFPGVDGRQRPGRKAEETHLENFIPRKKTSNIRESIEACRKCRQTQMGACPQMWLDGIFDRAKARERTAKP